MGQRILVIGESGTGKSTSLRNFASDEIKLIKVVSKNLPFRGKFDETVVTDNADKIIKEIKNTTKKVIVIDDVQYIMSNEYFRRAKEQGWDKYNDIGNNFFRVLCVADTLPDDVFVYYLSHIETNDSGKEKIKTIGKMIDEKLTAEGLFTIVLKSVVTDGVYSFQTQNSGHDTCKSPIGMFENYLVDNDLKMIDSIVREYWGYTTTKVEEKAVAANAPTKMSPKVKLVEGAAPLKVAPTVKHSSTDVEVSQPKEEKVEVTETAEQPTEVTQTANVDITEIVEVPAETQTVTSVPHEETNEEKMARMKAKIEAIKAMKK